MISLIRYITQRINGYWHLRKHAGCNPRAWGHPVIDAPNLRIGDYVQLFSKYRVTRIAGPGTIRIGNRVFINHGCTITARQAITIGDDVIIAEEVRIMDHPGHGMEGREIVPQPVTIGAGSWLGVRAIVLPGITIGPRSIVSAGAVVTRDVQQDTLVAGVPAREVRHLDYPAGITTAWYGH